MKEAGADVLQCLELSVYGLGLREISGHSGHEPGIAVVHLRPLRQHVLSVSIVLSRDRCRKSCICLSSAFCMHARLFGIFRRLAAAAAEAPWCCRQRGVLPPPCILCFLPSFLAENKTSKTNKGTTVTLSLCLALSEAAACCRCRGPQRDSITMSPGGSTWGDMTPRLLSRKPLSTCTTTTSCG